MREEQGGNGFDCPWISGADDPDKLSALLKFGRKRIVTRGEVFFQEEQVGDTFFLLTKGRVKVSAFARNGGEKILAIAEPISLLGESSVLLGLPFVGTGVAMETSELYCFRPQDVNPLLTEHQELAVVFLKSLIRKVRLLTLQVKQLSFMDAPCRVMHMLATVAAESGRPAKDGLAVDITRQDLASIAGSSRVTVHRLLSVLQRRGVVKNRRYQRGIVISDMKQISGELFPVKYSRKRP